MGATTYTRLPGQERTLWRRQSLYLGADHLLAVDTVFFRERYRRFYYADIQAVRVQRTPAHLVAAGVLATLFAASALVTALGLRSGQTELVVWGAFLAPFALVFFLWLVVSLVRGPSTRVTLYTAVGAEPLPSLGRLRYAERCLELLGAQIAAVQGLVSDAMSETLADPTARRAAAPNAVHQRTSAPVGPLERHAGLIRVLLASTLLGHGAASGLLAAAPGPWVSGGWLLTWLLLLFSSTGSLAVTAVGMPGARRVAGLALALALVAGFGAYVRWVIAATAASAPNGADLLRALTLTARPMRLLAGASGLLSFVLGLIGALVEVLPGRGRSTS